MMNKKPLPIIFTNAITHEVFNVSEEARTKNRDILLITYHGNINESCSDFFSCICALRDFVHVDMNTNMNEVEASDLSTSTSFTGSDKRYKHCESDDMLFRHRARDIIQSTTFIFIGRSNRKELIQFQNDMLHLSPKSKNGEKNILTEALSFLFPNDEAKNKAKENNTNDEDFRLVRDANALICNRLGSTLPPSWWGEDPLIIPKVFLLSANGGLNEIYVGKTDDRRSDGFHFGIGRRVHNGMFSCHTILEQLIEERIRRAKRVYKWCLYARQELLLIESE